ncbi:MAG: hypothetical protein ACI94O_002313, partial [Octadecabacter sp.]
YKSSLDTSQNTNDYIIINSNEIIDEYKATFPTRKGFLVVIKNVDL